MHLVKVYFVLCLVGAIIPLLPAKDTIAISSNSFPGWPRDFSGEPLKQLPLTNQEQGFAQDFPGKIGRFTDGSRELIIRWVENPTRKLHSAADCYHGIGYSVHPLPVSMDAKGNHWGSFTAKKDRSELRITERIYDRAGNSWSDVSSWYWTALFDRTHGPWWTVTIAEQVPSRKL